jgi:lysophospholipase L1-like esterase
MILNRLELPHPLKKNRMGSVSALACAALAVLTPCVHAQASQFSCGTGKVLAGSQRMDGEFTYSLPDSTNPKGNAGFDLAPAPHDDGSSCWSDKPFYFSIAEPDGNYKVTVELGSDSGASTTTVRAESRRLMVQQAAVAKGKRLQESFVVHVRTAEIHSQDGGEAKKVRLKPREIGALDWDEKLTLEFNGVHPSVRSIKIEPVNDVPTIYLAGDSTVVDQDKEPWAAWGQMLPRFFSSDISIANEAESGETIRSFVSENRLAKIMSTIKSGDYLLIQFAHNDQKQGAGYVPAATDYKDLMRQYIAQARSHGAFPVIVTAMNRRKFSADGHLEMTLGDYPQAARDVAAEQKVPLIDLNAMSKVLFETMGEQGTLKAFVHYPAHSFPGQDEELKDDTHFNSYGAYELARCVVQSIRDQQLSMAKYLRTNPDRFGRDHFDPAHPDDVAAFDLPASPMISTATPYGR